MTLAQTLLDAKTDMPTSLGTAELRDLGADILRQSLFSARLTNASAVQALRDAIQKILAHYKDGISADNFADARLKLEQLANSLGYTPQGGFPGEPSVPPAEANTLTDIFSRDRLDLILHTQVQMAQGAAANIWGNEPDTLEQYPAWELVRVMSVNVPRGLVRRGKGFVEEPDQAWDTAVGRWQAACADDGDDTAQKIFDDTGRMIARKDSDVWQALGDGAGGYDDTLGNDYEPFAFNSGMGRVQVSRGDFISLGGDASDVQPSETNFGSGAVKISKKRFDPDILDSLIARIDSGDLKFRVHVEVTP